ncbi:acyl-CoA dehydrogenase family protein [Mycobacterium colombiense]
MTDESWPIIEEAVLRLFGETSGRYTVIGPRLAELGWAEIHAEYPVEACELLFRAQGRTLAQTECLDQIMLAELAAALERPADAVLMPLLAHGCKPGSSVDRASGLVLGELRGQLAVPVVTSMGGVAVGVVDTQDLHGQRCDTFDASALWTAVTGPLPGSFNESNDAWRRAVAAAHRALATELVSLAGEMLRIAVDYAKARNQFGVPIGAFQSPRHLLAEACAAVEGVRALLDEAWRFGEPLCAHAAKAAAGRVHRSVAATAMQVCGAIGLTAEHDLHRYVSRGFQIDALLGSYQQLEASLAEQIFDSYAPGRPLPAVVMCA